MGEEEGGKGERWEEGGGEEVRSTLKVRGFHQRSSTPVFNHTHYCFSPLLNLYDIP